MEQKQHKKYIRTGKTQTNNNIRTKHKPQKQQKHTKITQRQQNINKTMENKSNDKTVTTITYNKKVKKT